MSFLEACIETVWAETLPKTTAFLKGLSH